MKPRPDLLSAQSPEGLEIYQLTQQRDIPACHLYMEAQVFTPDSRRLVVHSSAHAHGSDPADPNHRYLLCDVESGELTPLTDETGACAPSVSPDGSCLYYFVTQPPEQGGTISLRRRQLDGSCPEIVAVLDGPLPGTGLRPSRLYPLSTISSDGKRLAISCFLGDGRYPQPPWGLMVFDLQDGSCRLVLQGVSWCNVHPQYSRSQDPETSHDLLVQENHGNRTRPDGTFERLAGMTGADLHVIRDDGQHFRNLPFGRDDNEYCSGHQCWRGTSNWVITSAWDARLKERHLIEGLPMPHEEHNGVAAEGGRRRVLSGGFAGANFDHFATDRAGRRLITDHRGESSDALYLVELGEPGEEIAPGPPRFLMSPGASGKKEAHIHPFLSPDGRTAFFNSDESGQLQAYMIRHLDAAQR